MPRRFCKVPFGVSKWTLLETYRYVNGKHAITCKCNITDQESTYLWKGYTLEDWITLLEYSQNPDFLKTLNERAKKGENTCDLNFCTLEIHISVIIVSDNDSLKEHNTVTRGTFE